MITELFQKEIRELTTSLMQFESNVISWIKQGLDIWVKQIDLTFTNLYIALGLYEWWMAPFLQTLTPNQMAYIYNRIESKPKNVGKRYVDMLVVLLYRQNNYKMLDKIIGKWSSNNFRKRNNIFKEALWAHKKKKYVLSTLALVPQIEGIIREFTENTKRNDPWRNNFKKKYEYCGDLKTQYDKLLTNNITTQEQTTLSRNLRISLNINRIIELFDVVDFENQQSVNGYNRHGMLHGFCSKYNEVNSLKTFLLLDLIHDFISDNVVV